MSTATRRWTHGSVLELVGRDMPGMSKEEMAEAVKVGIGLWLDKQFNTLGRWTFNAAVSAALAFLAYLSMKLGLWSK